MAFRPGWRSYVAIDNAGGTPVNLSAYIDNADTPLPADMLDVSTFGSSSKRNIQGLLDGGDWTVSGPYDPVIHQHLIAVRAAQTAGTAGFTFLYGPGGSVAGQASIACEVLLSNYSPPSSVSGRAEWSATFRQDGAATLGTF